MKHVVLYALCFMLYASWFVIFTPSARAAVPTFDVGLNPKMDQLLVKTEDIRTMTRNIQCMISNLHRKEYGPPPVGCSGSSGSSGLGSFGGIFNKISSIASIFSGGNFGNTSGPAIDSGNQPAFDPYSQDSAEWLVTDSAGGQSTVDWSQDSAEWLVTDSAGQESTVNLDQDSTELVFKDGAGKESTVNLDQDSTELAITDSAGQKYTVNLDQDSTETVFKDGAGRPVTDTGIINTLKGILNKIGPTKDILKKIGSVRDIIKQIGAIKSIVQAVGNGGGLPSLTRSIDSLIGRAASIFGQCDSLDCMARKMAETAQGFLQQQILNWIRTGAVTNSGGSGAPLFVRDWDRYLLDAANYASSIFLGELRGTQLCEPFGSELKRIFSAGGGFNVGAISGGGFGGGISSGSGGLPSFSQRLNCNLNSSTRNFQPFFDDFDNGGWEAWADLTKPEVNPFGQYIMTLEEKGTREARAVQAARLEAESGQGFLGDKKCVEREITLPPDDFGDYEGGTQTYQDCPIVTPGIIQAEVTTKVAVSEQEKLQDVHEMKELFDTILRQEVQSILFSAGGLFSGSLSPSNSSSQPPSTPTPTRQPTPTPPRTTPTPTPMSISAPTPTPSPFTGGGGTFGGGGASGSF
ncbi:hypothetical protein A2739_01450 [Candidatus Giovannonibacteria bacterium RIFCSPHIGHO2_01_FULL_43_100]|nr:MAG: hypothetical protein A2739_01450 [Candidatus Giovannonibacteria bacterium RIFCSPHIGHO2_01_FULL_43_100]